MLENPGVLPKGTQVPVVVVTAIPKYWSSDFTTRAFLSISEEEGNMIHCTKRTLAICLEIITCWTQAWILPIPAYIIVTRSGHRSPEAIVNIRVTHPFKFCHVQSRSDTELENKRKFLQVTQVDPLHCHVELCWIQVLLNEEAQLCDENDSTSKGCQIVGDANEPRPQHDCQWPQNWMSIDSMKAFPNIEHWSNLQ